MTGVAEIVSLRERKRAAQDVASKRELAARYIEIIGHRLRAQGRTTDETAALEGEARLNIATIHSVTTYAAQKCIQPDRHKPARMISEDAVRLLGLAVASEQGQRE